MVVEDVEELMAEGKPIAVAAKTGADLRDSRTPTISTSVVLHLFNLIFRSIVSPSLSSAIVCTES